MSELFPTVRGVSSSNESSDKTGVERSADKSFLCCPREEISVSRAKKTLLSKIVLTRNKETCATFDMILEPEDEKYASAKSTLRDLVKLSFWKIYDCSCANITEWMLYRLIFGRQIFKLFQFCKQSKLGLELFKTRRISFCFKMFLHRATDGKAMALFFSKMLRIIIACKNIGKYFS